MLVNDIVAVVLKSIDGLKSLLDKVAGNMLMHITDSGSVAVADVAKTLEDACNVG